MKGVHKECEVLDVDLEKMNSIPSVLENNKLESKGFFPTITVQDFPFRGTLGFFILNGADG